MSEHKQLRIVLDPSLVSDDAPDSILMAEFRNVGNDTDLAEFAAALAEELAAHAGGRVTRPACAAMARASACLQAMTLLGYEAPEILAVLGFAAAKLEMQASADG